MGLKPQELHRSSGTRPAEACSKKKEQVALRRRKCTSFSLTRTTITSKAAGSYKQEEAVAAAASCSPPAPGGGGGRICRGASAESSGAGELSFRSSWRRDLSLRAQRPLLTIEKAPLLQARFLPPGAAKAAHSAATVVSS